MEQHPIPQQISSYEFKLVGEMTLKQFGKAAGGIILAVIVNAMPIVFFIKWPLIIIFALGGLAMAFLPYQDRPLETWMMAFLKSIYSPTIYLYKKKKPENWLDIDLSKTIKTESEEKIEVPQKEEKKVEEFINSLPSVEREKEEALLRPSTGSGLRTGKQERREEEPDSALRATTGKQEVKVAPRLDLKTQKLEATGEVVFGSIPMPTIPKSPNILVGMVLDSNQKIVEGAIVDLQDKNGNSSRVLKTNQLGQFKTLTPLSSGKYLIVTDKEGLKFDRVEILLENKIVEPIKIIAKA